MPITFKIFSKLRIYNIISACFASYGIASFIAIAILGYSKPPESWMVDFFWYYSGGICLQNNNSMYDLSCFSESINNIIDIKVLAGLSYPPHFAWIAYLFSLFPPDISARLFTFINIGATFALVIFIANLERRLRNFEEADPPLSHLIILGFVFGSSGLWAAVWLGQLSILLTLSLWIAFHQADKNKVIVPSLLFALASLKPQLVFFIFLWLLLNGRFKILAISAATAAIMASFAFYRIGVLPSIKGWFQAVGAYQNYPVNVLGSDQVMGIPSLLAEFGIHMSIFVAIGIGAAIVLVIRLKNRSEIFSPINLATILLVQLSTYSHPYDAVLIAPVFAFFWPSYSAGSRQLLIFLGSIAVFIFPQRFVTEALPFAAAGHFRTALIVVMTVVFVRHTLRGDQRFEFNPRTRRVRAQEL